MFFIFMVSGFGERFLCQSMRLQSKRKIFTFYIWSKWSTFFAIVGVSLECTNSRFNTVLIICFFKVFLMYMCEYVTYGCTSILQSEQSGDQLSLTCSNNNRTRTYTQANATSSQIRGLCSQLCRWCVYFITVYWYGMVSFDV